MQQGRPGASRKRTAYSSEVYWSACYNANLWQIRYNLQKDVIAVMFPILPIFCLLAAPPFFQDNADRPTWAPNPPVYQQTQRPPAGSAAVGAWTGGGSHADRSPGSHAPRGPRSRRAGHGKPPLDLRQDRATSPPLRQAVEGIGQLPRTPPVRRPADTHGIANPDRRSGLQPVAGLRRQKIVELFRAVGQRRR